MHIGAGYVLTWVRVVADDHLGRNGTDIKLKTGTGERLGVVV
jgi:hypothetical protein